MMTAVAGFPTIAETAALWAVDSIVIGALVAPFTWMLLRILRWQSASVRFAVWFSALVAIAVFPWLDRTLLSIGSHGQAASGAAIMAPASWAIYLFAVWAGIASIGLGRLCLSLWNLHVLRESLVPADLNFLDPSMRENLERKLRIRDVVVSTSDRINTPTAVGLVKPAVVIPQWLITELSPAELNQILLHEVAHLQRWDDWTNLAQKIVKALFFFHPAVWWIEKEISLEREMACDDVVLAESASPRAYAACLVHLAEKSVVRRSLALAQAAVGRVRQTSLRVAQILNVNRAASAKTANGWEFAVSFVGAFAVVCGMGISRAPHLVAFDEISSPVSTAVLSPSRSRLNAAPRALPAMFHTDEIVAHPNAKQTPHVVQAKARLRNTNRWAGASASPVSMQAMVPQPDASALMQTVGFHQPSEPTQAVFVVVEQEQYGISGHAIHSVSMWYILLINTPANSGRDIPRKET